VCTIYRGESPSELRNIFFVGEVIIRTHLQEASALARFWLEHGRRLLEISRCSKTQGKG